MDNMRVWTIQQFTPPFISNNRHLEGHYPLLQIGTKIDVGTHWCQRCKKRKSLLHFPCFIGNNESFFFFFLFWVVPCYFSSNSELCQIFVLDRSFNVFVWAFVKLALGTCLISNSIGCFFHWAHQSYCCHHPPIAPATNCSWKYVFPGEKTPVMTWKSLPSFFFFLLLLPSQFVLYGSWCAARLGDKRKQR